MFFFQNHYHLRVSLPGVEQNEIRISFVDKNIIEISGEVSPNIPKNFEKILAQEIFKGPFLRRIKFPSLIDQNQVKVNCQNGILELYVPLK